VKSARLILADIHQLEPFSVRSYQFLCRAAAFARYWPGLVELWFPGPPVAPANLEERLGAKLPSGLAVCFGPLPYFRLLGRQVASRARFRRWCSQRLTQLNREGQFCFFYFRTLKLAHYLAAAILRYGWKYAFESHELFYESSRKPDQFRAMEKSVYQNAALLFPITGALGERLREKLAVATPAQVAPLGHNGRNFELPDYDPEAPASFLYIGSLHRWKGLETAFEATAGLNVPFHVVGDAGGLERCRSYCLERGFRHVSFHGQVPPERLTAFYGPGAVCLLPLSNEEIARSYTSPLKLFEYLAAGRPIAAADLPTIREIVTDGEHARLIPVGDAGAWRRALEDLLRDRPRAAEMAANARRLAHSCTWEQRAKPLVERLAAAL
jgi:glycosyltransferase involved in cell wall biosynthesis